MRTVVVGLGIQGRKRIKFAGPDVVGTVDPVVPEARYQQIEQVPLDAYDAALVCTPDQAKFKLLSYLLHHRKHVLVEKPLLGSARELEALQQLSRASGAVCYTAYNHRFEPHIVNLKRLLDTGALGKLYLAKFFYGNGTARDVRNSAWRDQGLGVLPDLGSHVLDMALFLFGRGTRTFTPWSVNCFENRAPDHVVFGASGEPQCEVELTLLSWRNSFFVDVWGELGSAHIQCLCKWGPSKFMVRRRVLPSGRPTEEEQVIESPDPTWEAEYAHFCELCSTGGSNLENDLWIQAALDALARQIDGGTAA